MVDLYFLVPHNSSQADRYIITNLIQSECKSDFVANRIAQNVNYLVEENREAAIRRALYGARKGDVALIAGKGHEVYQEIGTKRFPFSDVKAVRLILQELTNKVQEQI